MGLLEDLNSGKYNLVLFGILFIFMFHQYWHTSSKLDAISIKQNQCKDNKEPMADVSNDIKEAIKQVYLADVEAIRNLSEVATKLQKEGLTIPGDLKVTGQIKANGEISNNSLSFASLNSKIDNVSSSLTSSINSTNTNLTNNVSSLQSQINTKLSNGSNVNIEIVPSAGRVFNSWMAGHKIAKRTYDGLFFTWNNPNDTTALYDWKLTAV